MDVRHLVSVTYFFRGNPLSPHRLLFLISSKGYFISTFPTDRTAYTTDFDGPAVDNWLEWKIDESANAPAIPDQSAMQGDPNLYSRVFYHLRYDILTLSQPVLALSH